LDTLIAHDGFVPHQFRNRRDFSWRQGNVQAAGLFAAWDSFYHGVFERFVPKIVSAEKYRHQPMASSSLIAI
jgi:hypothetical protein